MSAGHQAGSEAASRQFRRYILFELPYFLRRKTPQKLLSIIRRRWSRSGRRRIVFRRKQARHDGRLGQTLFSCTRGRQ